MPVFRVIDLRQVLVAPERQVEAKSPEEAAELALGLRVFRGGARDSLVCRVYWESNGNLNMVRLYSEVDTRRVQVSRESPRY